MRFFFFALCIHTLLLANDTSINPIAKNWQIQKKDPLLSYSAEFLLTSEGTPLGCVKRTGFLCPRYTYYLYDSKGDFEAHGTTRILSLGFFDPHLVDIDIYDSHTYIGMIQGKMFSRSRSKYIFYGALGQKIAVAYLNDKKPELLLFNGEENALLAKLDTLSYGDIGLVNLQFLSSYSSDMRFLKIFTAFVSDHHSSFTPPPEEIHHYHTHEVHASSYP